MITNKIFRACLFLPIAFWTWSLFTNNLGADPSKELNHLTGRMSLYYLLANLCLGILVSFRLRWPQALRFLPAERRWLGVITFVFLLFHLSLYLLMEGFETKAWTQIVTKTYLILGISAWLILFALAITSNNYSIRKLGGKRWKKLHRWVYLATALITAHVLLIEKADVFKYSIIFSVLWLAQALRFWRSRSSRSTSS